MWTLASRQLCRAARSPGSVALVATAHEPDGPVPHRRRASHSRRRSTAATRRRPSSPWAERLLPTVSIAAIVVAVSSWPTGRMPEAMVEPFRLAVLAYVVVGVGSRFVFAGLAPRRSVVAGAHVGAAHAGGPRRRVRSAATSWPCCSMAVAPILFLAFVARRRASMPASVRATSRPGVRRGADVRRRPSSGPSCRRWLRRRSAGSAGGRRRSGWSVRASRSAATAPWRCLLVWSESMRRRTRTSHGVRGDRRSSWDRSSATVDASAEVARILGDPSARLVVRGADAVATRRRVATLRSTVDDARSRDDHDRRPRR